MNEWGRRVLWKVVEEGEAIRVCWTVAICVRVDGGRSVRERGEEKGKGRTNEKVNGRFE